MASTTTERVSMSVRWLWVLRVGCVAIGLVLGLVVRPVTEWAIETLDLAPAPLRLAAEVPTPWAVLVLALVGLVVGFWVSEQAERDTLTVTVDDDSLITSRAGDERYLARARVAAVFTDPKDLVVLDVSGREAFRAPATDLPQDDLAAALRRHGYAWRGRQDPYETEYRRWVDGHPDLDDATNALLRARRTALVSQQPAEVDDLRDRLQEHGLVVRDRGKVQQYRRIPGS